MVRLEVLPTSLFLPPSPLFTVFDSILRLVEPERTIYLLHGLWDACVTILWIVGRLHLKPVSCTGGGNILADSCQLNNHRPLLRTDFVQNLL